MDNQRINYQLDIYLGSSATTSTMTNQDSIPSHIKPPLRYEQVTSNDDTAKFKDLQSRAIQIIIDKKPIEQIAFKDGLASFTKDIPNDGFGVLTPYDYQDSFIKGLSRYCVSDLCHDKVMTCNRQWKNNFSTKILNTFSLKKHIFKRNANTFGLTDIKAVDSNFKQQIALMLLDEYNLGDGVGLNVACTSIYMVELLHQTSLTPENQVNVLREFIQQFDQFTRENLHDTKQRLSFNQHLYALINNLNKYIQQQKTIELDNEFYMSIFNNYFSTVEQGLLQN
jgi:uncharacterized protein YeeX (DUF496 family)